MTCKEIETLLPGWIDGEVSGEEKRHMDEHLESCASCARALENLRKSTEWVRNLERVEPPPWLKTRIMAQVHEEAKRSGGIFRKLFFPLHIKVPIQALATILIAVVAWNVYKTGEPEFGRIAPPPITKETPKARAPHESVTAPGPESVPTIREKEADRRAENREKKTFAPPPMAGGDLRMRRQASVPEAEKTDAEKPAEPSKAARPEVAPLKDEESLKGTGAMGREKMDRDVRSQIPELKKKSMKAPAGAIAKEGREIESAPASAPVLSAAVPPRPELVVTLLARDPAAAEKEAETIFNQVGGQVLDRQTRKGRVTLTARIRAETLETVREKLDLLGQTREDGYAVSHSGGALTIRIEIRPN